jgi:transmembrane sensor
VTAWRRGEAVFDDVTLAEAASELGRYGGPRVVVRDPAVSALRVSGAFSTGDAREFAAAVAELHGLRVEDRGSELVLDRR